MRFTSYKFEGLASFGVEREGKVIDLPALFTAQGRAGVPLDVVDLIARCAPALAEVEAALSKADEYPIAVRDLARLETQPPVVRPPQMFCVGRNYAEHAKEAGFEMSPDPILFPRYVNSLIGSGADILFPKVSEQLDWEGELAVVIGRSHKGQIACEAAMDHVFGYTAFNDVTVRDYQFRTTQYLAGKNFRTTGPLGPVVVTKDEIADPHALNLVTRVNGEVMQSDNTSSMYFDIPYIINHLSEFIDLAAGDVIAMGTPAGVGFKRKPPLFLKIGDVVEVELEGVGTLTNKVVADG